MTMHENQTVDQSNVERKPVLNAVNIITLVLFTVLVFVLAMAISGFIYDLPNAKIKEVISRYIIGAVFAVALLALLIFFMLKRPKVWAPLRENGRRFVLRLKISPHLIPLAVDLVAFIIFSFNLTDLASGAGFANVKNLGFYVFISMLLSILSLVIFINTFPKRKKINKIMLILLVLFLCIIILCNVLYRVGLDKPFNEGLIDWDDTSMVPPAARAAIIVARKTISVDVALLAITLVLLATYPLYRKLLKKIDTSVELSSGASLTSFDKIEE